MKLFRKALLFLFPFFVLGCSNSNMSEDIFSIAKIGKDRNEYEFLVRATEEDYLKWNSGLQSKKNYFWIKCEVENFDKTLFYVHTHLEYSTPSSLKIAEDDGFFNLSLEIFDKMVPADSIEGRKDVFFSNYYGDYLKFRNRKRDVDTYYFDNVNANYDFEAPNSSVGVYYVMDTSDIKQFYVRIKMLCKEPLRYDILNWSIVAHTLNYYDDFGFPRDEYYLERLGEEVPNSYKMFHLHPYRDIDSEVVEDSFSIPNEGDFRYLHYKANKDERKIFNFSSEKQIAVKVFDYMPVGRNDKYILKDLVSSLSSIKPTKYITSFGYDFNKGDEIFIRINEKDYSSVDNVTYSLT